MAAGAEAPAAIHWERGGGPAGPHHLDPWLTWESGTRGLASFWLKTRGTGIVQISALDVHTHKKTFAAKVEKIHTHRGGGLKPF